MIPILASILLRHKWQYHDGAFHRKYVQKFLPLHHRHMLNCIRPTLPIRDMEHQEVRLGMFGIGRSQRHPDRHWFEIVLVGLDHMFDCTVTIQSSRSILDNKCHCKSQLLLPSYQNIDGIWF